MVTWCLHFSAVCILYVDGENMCVQWGFNWIRAVFLTGSGVCAFVCYAAPELWGADAGDEDSADPAQYSAQTAGPGLLELPWYEMLQQHKSTAQDCVLNNSHRTDDVRSTGHTASVTSQYIHCRYFYTLCFCLHFWFGVFNVKYLFI